MINNLTYKQQVLLYIGIVVISFILVFKIALKPTFELKKVCKEKEAVLETVSTAPVQIKAIGKKLNQIDNQFKILSFEENTSRDRILEEIAKYCSRNRLTVYNYPEIHQFTNNTFTIESNRIIVRGRFKNLLKLVNYLETKADFGKIISLSFYSEINRKTKRKELFLELIFQNISNNE
jgi:hypothetical protein